MKTHAFTHADETDKELLSLFSDFVSKAAVRPPRRDTHYRNISEHGVGENRYHLEWCPKIILEEGFKIKFDADKYTRTTLAGDMYPSY